MKKILFIATLSCLLYMQAEGQNMIPTDSLIGPDSVKIISPKKVYNKVPEGRQTFSKKDSLGNTLVLSIPTNELKLIIYQNDTLKKSKTSIKNDPSSTYLIAGQMVTQEGLYRLSESFFNGALDSSSYRKLYSETLQYTIDLIAEQVDLEDARTEQIKAETERSKIEVEKLKLELEILKMEKGIYPKEQGTQTTKQEGEK